MPGFMVDIEKLKEWKENLEFDQYGIDHILEILLTVTAGLHAVGRAAHKLEPGEEDLINGDLTRELHKATEALGLYAFDLTRDLLAGWNDFKQEVLALALKALGPETSRKEAKDENEVNRCALDE